MVHDSGDSLPGLFSHSFPFWSSQFLFDRATVCDPIYFLAVDLMLAIITTMVQLFILVLHQPLCNLIPSCNYSFILLETVQFILWPILFVLSYWSFFVVVSAFRSSQHSDLQIVSSHDLFMIWFVAVSSCSFSCNCLILSLWIQILGSCSISSLQVIALDVFCFSNESRGDGSYHCSTSGGILSCFSFSLF